MKTTYPQLNKLNLTIVAKPVPHVRWDDIEKATLATPGLYRYVNEGLTGQTCYREGCYPWDLEALLERFFTGRKTGTQLVWD